MFSCIQSKKITYLKSNEIKDSIFIAHQVKDYKLRSGDVLKVEIIGLDPNISELFNDIGQQTSSFNQNTTASILLAGHRIDSEGNIVLPLIGSIPLKGLTMDEASIAIQQKVDDYFINAKAKINLISFRVTILGEVKKPGKKTGLIGSHYQE